MLGNLNTNVKRSGDSRNLGSQTQDNNDLDLSYGYDSFESSIFNTSFFEININKIDTNVIKTNDDDVEAAQSILIETLDEFGMLESIDISDPYAS